MTTQTGPQLKNMQKPEEAGRLGLQWLIGTGSPVDNPAAHTAQTQPQPPHQQQGTRVTGGSRIVLAVLSTLDGMAGFNNLPLSPANIQVPP